MGEAFDEKFHTETNKHLIAESVRFIMDKAAPELQAAFKYACQNVLSEENRTHIEQAYNFGRWLSI